MKKHLSLEKQVEKLIERGLHVGDPELFITTLKTQNYYRLRGYFYPFFESPEEHRFKIGTSELQVLDLVKFDNRLRNLLFEALAVFEIRFRSALAFHAGSVDPHFHTNGLGLNPSFMMKDDQTGVSKFETWTLEYERAIQKQKESDIVVWHSQAYGGKIPIWAAVELLELGKTSLLFRALDEPIATRIANEFGAGASFMRGAVACLNDLRNHVAHHSRIWNFHFVVNPPVRAKNLPTVLTHLRELTDYERHKVFTRLSLLLWINQTQDMGIDFPTRLWQILDDLPKSESITLHSMGFTKAFQESYLWDGTLAK